jgi:hypothetical protein
MPLRPARVRNLFLCSRKFRVAIRGRVQGLTHGRTRGCTRGRTDGPAHGPTSGPVDVGLGGGLDVWADDALRGSVHRPAHGRRDSALHGRRHGIAHGPAHLGLDLGLHGIHHGILQAGGDHLPHDVGAVPAAVPRAVLGAGSVSPQPSRLSGFSSGAALHPCQPTPHRPE